jgi:hypothetical protein
MLRDILKFLYLAAVITVCVLLCPLWLAAALMQGIDES